MSLILDCADKYGKYIGYDYTFILDCDISVEVMFAAQHFHHLAGLHYLKDIAQLDTKRENNTAAGIYKAIKTILFLHLHLCFEPNIYVDN